MRFAPEKEAAISRYQYMPFGAGPRICIGMAFAMIEATAMLATMLQAARFDRSRASRTPGRSRGSRCSRRGACRSKYGWTRVRSTSNLERLRARRYDPSRAGGGGDWASKAARGNAQHHHRHECQGRRRQIDARAGPRRDALGLPRQANSGHRCRCPSQHQPYADAPAAADRAAGRGPNAGRLPDFRRAEGTQRRFGGSTWSPASPTSTTRVRST